MVNINLFVYGTLKDDLGLIGKLTGKSFQFQQGEVEGFEIIHIGEYPAAKPANGAISGVLLKDVDPESLEKLDDYEEVRRGLYRRELVNVMLNGGKKVEAYAYVARAQPSRALQLLGLLVGWKVRFAHPLDETKPWRNKCRASLTSVSVVFAANSGLLVFLGERLLSEKPVFEFLDYIVAAFLYAIVLLLSIATGGFSDFESWLKKSWVLCIAAIIASYMLLTMGGFVPLLQVLLLLTSELVLVASLEFYDSALNPEVDIFDVRNLEFGASRFYYVGLWLSVLSALLLVSSFQLFLGMISVLVWAFATIFVARFEDAFHVKPD